MGNASQRIQWYEGMLLEPQHFQQSYHDIKTEMLGYLKVASPFFWGIQRIKIDPAALVAGIFRILELEAISVDGSFMVVDETSTVYPELDITQLLPKNSSDSLMIYLAAVRYRPDSANTAGDYPRYLSTQVGPVVDENTGESSIYISKVSLRISVLAGNDIPTRYVTFPIAKVIYKEDGYTLDEFSCPRTDMLEGTDLNVLCTNLVAEFRQKINFLSSKLQSSDIAQNDPLFNTYKEYYTIIAPEVPGLEVMLLTQLVHPFEIYRELCRIAGGVSRMIVGQIPPIFQPYQHESLLSIFKNVCGFIGKMLDLIKQISTPIPFQKTEKGFSLAVQPAWTFQNTWVIGVRLGAGMSSSDAAKWLNNTIVATTAFMDGAREKRILGASRTLVLQVPELGLLPEDGVIFAKIMNDPQFIDPGSTLILMNTNDTEDSRPDDIVLYIADQQES